MPFFVKFKRLMISSKVHIRSKNEDDVGNKIVRLELVQLKEVS
jgi:hypothetical protein